MPFMVFFFNRDSGKQTTIHRLRGRIRMTNKHKHCKDVNKPGLTHIVVYAENAKKRYCQSEEFITVSKQCMSKYKT